MAARKSGLQGLGRLRRKLRRLPEAATAALKAVIAEEAEFVQYEQLRRVPVNTGNLASAIEIRISRDGLTATIGVGARTKRAARLGWYAHLVEFGTAPHRIRARRGGAGVLADGETVFGRHANHPGTPARPFVLPALKENQGDVLRRIDHAVDAALRRVAELPVSGDG